MTFIIKETEGIAETLMNVLTTVLAVLMLNAATKKDHTAVLVSMDLSVSKIPDSNWSKFRLNSIM